MRRDLIILGPYQVPLTLGNSRLECRDRSRSCHVPPVDVVQPLSEIPVAAYFSSQPA